MLAEMTEIKSMLKDRFTLGLPLKKAQKYRKIMTADTKKAASQIRRCQKRVRLIGLILPPNN